MHRTQRGGHVSSAVAARIRIATPPPDDCSGPHGPLEAGQPALDTLAGHPPAVSGRSPATEPSAPRLDGGDASPGRGTTTRQAGVATRVFEPRPSTRPAGNGSSSAADGLEAARASRPRPAWRPRRADPARWRGRRGRSRAHRSRPRSLVGQLGDRRRPWSGTGRRGGARPARSSTSAARVRDVAQEPEIDRGLSGGVGHQAPVPTRDGRFCPTTYVVTTRRSARSKAPAKLAATAWVLVNYAAGERPRSASKPPAAGCRPAWRRPRRAGGRVVDGGADPAASPGTRSARDAVKRASRLDRWAQAGGIGHGRRDRRVAARCEPGAPRAANTGRRQLKAGDADM